MRFEEMNFAEAQNINGGFVILYPALPVFVKASTVVAGVVASAVVGVAGYLCAQK